MSQRSSNQSLRDLLAQAAKALNEAVKILDAAEGSSSEFGEEDLSRSSGGLRDTSLNLNPSVAPAPLDVLGGLDLDRIFTARRLSRSSRVGFDPTRAGINAGCDEGCG